MSDFVVTVTPPPSKWQRGDSWRTRGGWVAEIIYIRRDPFLNASELIVIHHNPSDKAWEPQEVVVHHRPDGTPHTRLSIDEAPSWGGHPADLVAKIRLRKAGSGT